MSSYLCPAEASPEDSKEFLRAVNRGRGEIHLRLVISQWVVEGNNLPGTLLSSTHLASDSDTCVVVHEGVAESQ